MLYNVTIHGIWKSGTDESICKAEIETQAKRTELWTLGEGRVGRVNWEIRICIHTLLCRKQMTDENLALSGGSAVKNLPAMQDPQEMGLQSLGREDPLEEGMVTRSSVLAWRIPWTEESAGLQSVGSHRVRHHCSDLARTQPGLRGLRAAEEPRD